MNPHPLWRESKPPDVAWKAPKGLTQIERAAEQDNAAEGRDAREIRLPDDRRVHASIALRVLRQGRRIYAYLRWSVSGKTHERYVGEVFQDSRQANLAEAWHTVRQGNLLDMEASSNTIAQETVTDSWASSPASRAIMRANKRRDTRPEKALRSAVHALGLRYRVDTRPIKDVRRTADLVFPRQRVAVFLDGCFWHGCERHHRPAKGATAEFWNTKIADNRRRDANTDQRLKEAGWETVRVWEHEDPAVAARRIEERVKANRVQ
ncbi:very short patch repair endonuclease [Haloactinomyces albus]|uniref:DNA mismatch endonuclease (Patch repair protein) n=1 Tax=Haloactinomyces albus TaxID=1352928 RepID=A0AAE4CLG9_9ACTN|nr:very short patch repair endonuclease [Haloactinomyces albus]MDR7302260.1 DNA mismatch endonuclease (patch repair protein) [Haloactinomyces albus]